MIMINTRFDFVFYILAILVYATNIFKTRQYQQQ